MRQTPTHLHLLIKDDRCGVFDRIQDAFHIASPQLALLELSKGKLTTQPEFHTGRGLFFTSRLFDVFDLYANQLTYQHNHWQRKEWLKANPMGTGGTAIFMSLALNSTRTLEDVFGAHSKGAKDLSFRAPRSPCAWPTQPGRRFNRVARPNVLRTGWRPLTRWTWTLTVWTP